MFLVQLEVNQDRSVAPLACRLKKMTRLSVPKLSLNGVPTEEQEILIVEDILLVMLGCEGNYIRYSSAYDPTSESHTLKGPKFTLPHGLNPGLRDLTERLLRIVSSYIAINAFVDVRSQAVYGLVNHALAAAIREKLLEYFNLIGVLDHQSRKARGLTLNNVHKSMQGISDTLVYIYSLTQDILRQDEVATKEADNMDAFDNLQQMIDLIRDRTPSKRICKGGAVLCLLSDRLRLESGNQKVQELATYLFHKASKPYCRMLYRWINFGDFEDPYSEFMIKEAKTIHKSLLNDDYTDEYWEKRYTFRENIPLELDDVKHKIFIAGKYINVLRESDGIAPQASSSTAEGQFLDDPNIVEDVERAYAYANKSLLKHLIETHHLSARLLSLKHYFFLDHSEFFSNFLDLSMGELRKPVADVSISRLQSLLDISLQFGGSTVSNDPYKEDVKVELNETGLTDWLMDVVNVLQHEDAMKPLLEDGLNHNNTERRTEGDSNLRGIAALQLDYTVPFPLSLIISKKAIIRYQIIFRHLLSLKYVELLLTNVWQEHIKLKAWRAKSSLPEVESAKRRVWILRGRMLDMVQQILYFCTMEIIELESRKFASQMDRSVTVDQLMRDHINFLDTCLKECMLTTGKLLKVLIAYILNLF